MLDALGINATLFAQIFNFIILLIFLRIVAWKPLINMIEQRQKHIENTVNAAEDERKKAEELRASYLAEMQRSKEGAQQIIADANKAAEAQKDQIIAAAKAESERIKENATAEIQREKEKAVAELREQVASLAILVAGKVVSQKITEDLQHSMVQEFIKEAGDLPC
ncbi:ATP synthase F0, B subunit [Desulfofarcimen acetoxidans DSM 771]|uniref:ATP synthase subunit b n=1 Tax=Desulfofarcimen acetoxidans (strain ATCC 49208 / DSM 771 / KCTC 5769 / VKM B-1644 / 5575) TaxID=485916 RepID=C8VZ92_DESAS|nr:F0F1 ATP synthase subunit B [Desulfofarcimen acetoxidans]ACV64837.1 ATP synthase F0, B subunit [Desulfofarcimen acetoxidans DSM 771]